MKTRTLVMNSVLFVCLHSATFGQGGETPRPQIGGAVAISPGSADALLVTGPCPTFSWSTVPGSQGYEIAVLPFDERTALAGGGGAAAEDEPLIEVTLPANASSWTPSRDRCLAPGESYAWYVRALGTSREEWSEGKAFEVGKPQATTDETRKVEKSNGTGGTPEVLAQIEIVQNMLAETELRLRARLDQIEATVDSGNNRILANLVTIQGLVTPAPYQTDVTVCGILAGTAQAGLGLGAQFDLGGEGGAGADVFGNGSKVSGKFSANTRGSVGVNADATLNARVCINFPVDQIPELDAQQRVIAEGLNRSGLAVQNELVDLAEQLGLGARDLEGPLMSALSQLRDISIPTNPATYLAGAPEQLSGLIEALPLNSNITSVVQDPSAAIGGLSSLDPCVLANSVQGGPFRSILSELCKQRLPNFLVTETRDAIVSVPDRINQIFQALQSVGDAAGGFFGSAGDFFGEARDFFGF